MPISFFLIPFAKSFFIAILLVQMQIQKLDMVKILLLYISAIWFGQIQFLDKFLEAKANRQFSDGLKMEKGFSRGNWARSTVQRPDPTRAGPGQRSGARRVRVKPARGPGRSERERGRGDARTTQG